MNKTQLFQEIEKPIEELLAHSHMQNGDKLLKADEQIMRYFCHSLERVVCETLKAVELEKPIMHEPWQHREDDKDECRGCKMLSWDDARFAQEQKKKEWLG